MCLFGYFYHKSRSFDVICQVISSCLNDQCVNIGIFFDGCFYFLNDINVGMTYGVSQIIVSKIVLQSSSTIVVAVLFDFNKTGFLLKCYFGCVSTVLRIIRRAAKESPTKYLYSIVFFCQEEFLKKLYSCGSFKTKA